MNNRTLLKYHSYLGLIAGLFLLVIGLTGAVLAFNEAIDEAIFKEYQVEVNPESLALDKAIATVQSNFPEWETRIVHFKKGESILFNLRLPDARRFVFIHPETGQIIANIDANATITKWILKLHYSFFAGAIGRILVLIVGVLFFLSLITGIILYRKVILKTLLFQVKVKRGHVRNFYSALHRYIGVWALLLNLVLVITGIFLAYKVAKAGLETPKMPEPERLIISVEECLTSIKTAYPDFTPTYIRLPKQATSTITVNGIFNTDSFYYSQYYNKFQLDFKTGDIISVTKVADANLMTRLDSMISPLHFGQYGGFFIKLLYCFIGLSGPFLSVTGFVIWYKKKSKSR
ncbi:PepSY-associated TM helix domain-containing protein [Aestuariibaculum suncheonense]|uniref:PepSY domain-containing protein n=1 Tax=Aestuariibaculum suncheonense TaxID=1028745 RepID=A0A8J6UAH6_9FLAO|nr:PepSY-associated TM helix domain-containing protein [Aestuariibaculum suncheonense]MBD0834855.1 PepSY domain-containing protein [Aestuariibaculum suncheonense]